MDQFDYLALVEAGVILIGVLIWRRSLPTVESMQDLAEMMNTKGGIILLLWFTSMIFFLVGMRMVYWGVNRMLEGKLSSDNALILSAFNWITGSAFGGAFGAMIKTMTGEDKKRTEKEKQTSAKRAHDQSSTAS